MTTCRNKGCGKDVDDSVCRYHSGAPLFHEGLKGWSCCPKRVTDFNEFLRLPGCVSGVHSTKEPENNKPVDTAALRNASANAAVPSNDSPSVKDVVEKKETFAGGMVAAEPMQEAPKVSEKDLNDPKDAVVEEGTLCKRKSCGQTFSVNSNGECRFHHGQPLFHEGSKGWTCCTRRVLEFDEFLKLPGCTVGRHRFLDSVPTNLIRDCRRDFYQTPDKVILSVFAKKVDKTLTKVEFNDGSLSIKIIFTDGFHYTLDTPLFQPIVPSECTVEILSSKLEIILKKANGFSWPSLEPNDKLTSWTTFGTTGSVGTIGGKEAIISTDAPLHLLK